MQSFSLYFIFQRANDYAEYYRHVNQGKNNPRATDPPPDNVKNPHFLVLISDNFVEARIALTRSGLLNFPSNQNPVKMDVTPTGPAPLMSGPLPSGSFCLLILVCCLLLPCFNFLNNMNLDLR